MAMDRQGFEAMYGAGPPWETGRPQEAFVRLEESGAITGDVLDAGCGTGENALFLASRGHAVWGVDFVPGAVERASAKAAERGLSARFVAADALELGKLGRTFDTVIDSGLFHVFDDGQQRRYVAGLHEVLRPGGVLHFLCFSDEEPGTEGPRRVKRGEIRAAFNRGWTVENIAEDRFDVRQTPGGPTFSPGGPRSWLVTVRREG